ncbi:hypothetical protein HQQ94_08000 [Shewanella sp. VB17]|uniref:hypothetical protein n=1 Tax=Shewanella sp. VB17 TaxID=2739432 RepID=UPI001565BC4F|nr:hypothetical protein [Shewanella sp. VB17]NRD73184.1 hypothetical protein [Shewanella sp. VB17]
MKNKLILTLAALGMGFGLAASVNADDGNRQYCAENPSQCHCYIKSGSLICVVL